MKVLQFVFSLLIVVAVVEISRADDGMDIITMKRPFCNAFTGCGRKRDPSYASSGFQLPIPLYRALLRLSSLRNGAAEVRMRQRPLALIGPEPLLQLGLQPPRLAPAATLY